MLFPRYVIESHRSDSFSQGVEQIGYTIFDVGTINTDSRSKTFYQKSNLSDIVACNSPCIGYVICYSV